MVKTPRRSVSVCIVGCGAVAERWHGSALKRLARQDGAVSVGAVFDPSGARIAALQKGFPEARPLRSLDELAGANLDLAIIASPPRFHAEQSIQALEAGLHVLCEKPMATNVADAERMIETAARRHRLLAVGLFRRFFPASRTMREAIRAEIIGRVQTFCFREGGPFGWPAESDSLFRRSMGGGGVTMDIGVHVLDQLLWCFGPPESIEYSDDAMGGVEANALIELRFPGGPTGTVQLSRDWRLPNRFTGRGPRGWIGWNVGDANQIEFGFEGLTNGFHACISELVPALSEPAIGQPAADFNDSFLGQIRNVVAAVRGEEDLLVPGEEGIRSLRVIEDCYRDRSLMKMPWLTDAERMVASEASAS